MSQRTFSREACHSGLTSERSLPYNRRVSWYDGALATRIPSFIVSALSVTSTRLPDERRDSFFVFAFLRFTCLRPINVCPTTAGITKHVSDTRRRRSDVRRCRHSRVLAGGFVGFLFINMRILPMVLGLGISLVYECISFSMYNQQGLNLFGKPGVSILSNWGFIIVVTLLVMLVMTYLFQYSGFGYNRRAIQGNQKLAHDARPHRRCRGQTSWNISRTRPTSRQR